MKDKNVEENKVEHEDQMNESAVDIENKEEVQEEEEVQENDTGGSEDGEKSEEEPELERIKEELAESKDKYLRLYSEFENYRRRTSKEKLEMAQTANEDLMSSLLPILDDFERAQKSINDKETDIKSVKEGFDLIYNKFNKILQQKGLSVMEGKKGMDFDPEIHEAITQIPSPKPKLKGKVVDVIEKGYLLKEKVIRYAKVVIGN